MATPLQSFYQSCNDFSKYPKNLTTHDALPHTLQAYHERLEKRLNDRFYPLCDEHKAAVVFWDLENGGAAYRWSCVGSLDGMKHHLRQALLHQSRDPDCRYIFLQAGNSRAPLQASPEMFKFLFSYHQVMPSFLDFIFPFGKQVYPQDSYFSGLREDARFAPGTDNTGLTALGRSGSGLRLCYNLRSVEPTKDDPSLPWTIRQSAVYHQFDTNTGAALWIVVKANNLINTRMIEATEATLRSRSSTRAEAFSATLRSHLIMCDWSGENWRWYINDLETQLQSLTKHVYATQPEKELIPSSPICHQGFPMSPRSLTLTSPPLSPTTTCNDQPDATRTFFPRTMTGVSSPKVASRTSTFDDNTSSPPSHASNACKGVTLDPNSSRLAISRSRTNSFPIQQAMMSSLTRIRAWMSHKDDTTDEASIGPPETRCIASKKWGPQEHPLEALQQDIGEPQENLSFRDLQRIQHIEEKAQETYLVLGFNIQVLDDLSQHYKVLLDDVNFPENLKGDCQGDLSHFDRCVLGVKKDLHMLQSRTQNLLDRLANRKNLLNGILQHRSVRTSADFAQKAQQSADHMERMTTEMHDIAKKTKQETVSMRVITTVTLFFLPATFIATFMSTDILKFEDGKRDFQVDGLRTYLAIALPLTVLTFVAWYVIYCVAKRNEPCNAPTSPEDTV